MAKGGGGAWKVAYADFVTAMMAFFMVMWLVGQKPEVKAAIAEHFRNPSGRRMTGTPNSSILRPKESGSGGRKNRLRSDDSESTQTKMTDDGNRSNVGTVIDFQANKTVLDDRAREQLDALLPELLGKPHRVEVRGHAIEDAIGGMQAHLDAWQISYQRSLEAMRYLVEHGVAPERIRLSQSGGSEPVFVGSKPDSKKDARVEVFLLNEVFEDTKTKAQRLVSLQEATTAEPPPPTAEELAAAEAAKAHGGGH